jgi:glucose-6-phosphate 1-dehydrogenase
MRGDDNLFAGEDAVLEEWRIVDPVLDLPTPPLSYEPGSWGPAEADRLTAAVPGGWRRPTAPGGRQDS